MSVCLLESPLSLSWARLRLRVQPSRRRGGGLQIAAHARHERGKLPPYFYHHDYQVSFSQQNTFLVRIVEELDGFIIGNASLRLKAIKNVWSTVQSIKTFALSPSGPLRVGLAPFLCYVGVVGLRKADISG